LFYLGAFASARTHLEEGVAIYDPQQHHSHALQYVDNPGLHCLTFASWALWYLGYPEQALHRSQQACTLAQELAHPGSQAMTLYRAARLRQYRRDVQQAYELAEASMTISTEHGVATYLALGTFLRGWALFQQGQGGEEEAMAQMRQGLAAIRAVGNEVALPGHLVWLAEAYGKRGQAEEGLPLLDEAWSIVDKSGQSYHNAELHRIEGELRLRQSAPDAAQAEACFQQALDVARQQQARSLELRSALSLARLWQRQDKCQAAHDLLAPVYDWFTEGFDTADLQEAKASLDELTR
jgi:predicted ATPase